MSLNTQGNSLCGLRYHGSEYDTHKHGSLVNHEPVVNSSHSLRYMQWIDESKWVRQTDLLCCVPALGGRIKWL